MTFSIGDIVRIKGTDIYGIITSLLSDKAQVEWMMVPNSLVMKDPTTYYLTMYLEKMLEKIE